MLAVYMVFSICRICYDVCDRAAGVAAVAVLAVTGVVGCCVVDCFDFVAGVLLASASCEGHGVGALLPCCLFCQVYCHVVIVTGVYKQCALSILLWGSALSDHQ